MIGPAYLMMVLSSVSLMVLLRLLMLMLLLLLVLLVMVLLRLGLLLVMLLLLRMLVVLLLLMMLMLVVVRGVNTDRLLLLLMLLHLLRMLLLMLRLLLFVSRLGEWSKHQVGVVLRMGGVMGVVVGGGRGIHRENSDDIGGFFPFGIRRLVLEECSDMKTGWKCEQNLRVESRRPAPTHC